MGEFRDLTNQRFGRLTVIKAVGKDKHGHYKWKCKCECGGEVTTASSRLITGKTKSCGCFRTKSAFEYDAEYAGKKFGRLMTIGFVEMDDKHKIAIFDFRCDCGKYHKASLSSVKSGRIQSCGCSRKKNSSFYNKKYGGKRFNRLTAIKEVKRDTHNRPIFLFRCDCGNHHEARLDGVICGKVLSCGCYAKEISSKIAKISKLKHGHDRKGRVTSTYRSWASAKGRCFNKKNQDYKNYGGRSKLITMCSRWRDSFEAFLEDMKERDKGMSLDRINNDLGYFCGNHELCDECRKNDWPMNCRWATPKRQCRNQRKTIMVEYEGKEIPLIDMVEQTGISYHILYNRYVRYGWPIEKVLNTPIK